MSGNPAKTAFTRVFLIPNRARGDRKPSYESCMKMMGLSHDHGETEPIYCPDPINVGKFIEEGTLKAAGSRPSTSLVGRYFFDLRSELMRLAEIGCAMDVQLHMGPCHNLGYFNEFAKDLILEGVAIGTYGTDDLGALGPDENSAINETGDITARKMYEVVPLTLEERGADLVTVELVDVVHCDKISCDECEDVSEGCDKWYAVSVIESASPGTMSEVVFSIDKGANWNDHDVDTLLNIATGIACLGDYIVVISNVDLAHHYALKSQFDSGADPIFTQVLGGYVAGGGPNDIWSTGLYAFIVGDTGYVYGLEDATGAVVVLDAGVATGQQLNAVHALNSEFAVAVGNNGAVIFTQNGVTWQAATGLGMGRNLFCVWVKSETEWWIGDNQGRLVYTIDQGATYFEKAFPGSGTGAIYDIQFPTDSVGFMTHTTVAALGRLLRSYDGGYSWIVLPEATGVIPANSRINAIATCPVDANIVVGVGLGTAPDGFIVVGED